MVGKYKWNAWNDLGDMSQVRVLNSGSKADVYTMYANTRMTVDKQKRSQFALFVVLAH